MRFVTAYASSGFGGTTASHYSEMTFVTAGNLSRTRDTRAPARSLLERCDPRNSVGAATGWLIAAVSLGLALAANAWVSAVASENLLELKYKILSQYAERLSSQLDITLNAHLHLVRAAAAILGASPAQSLEQHRDLLDQLQRATPEFAWAGYVEPSGRVALATGGVLEGQSLADRPWFARGLQTPWISDLREVPLHGDPQTAAEPLPNRYIVLVAPVVNAQGHLFGAIVAHLSGAWAERLKRDLDRTTHPKSGIETFILDRDGIVLLGPEASVGKVWSDFADHSKYVEAGTAEHGFGSFAGLGWTVQVREIKAHALADVARLRLEIFAIVFSLGLLAAVVGAWGARRVLRRIGLLAQLADTVSPGAAAPSSPLNGRDEAARIGHTLTALVAQLKRDKAELQALNAELDARVAARTREVERLSDENQYAAVIRERLRIARELHDTLAHSMMAMLTQIRLLRKFVDTNPDALKDELARAEEAAQVGLNEARAAITQMRYNAVRDGGLGAAVSSLVQRFEQRSGITVEYSSDARAAGLADSRAETVFRMVEELFHNAEVHSRARRVRVVLRHDRSANVLVVSVADDGIGFDPSTSVAGHYGLRGLREQAAMIGAVLQIHSGLRRGTEAILTLPLSE
jgi:signal transduction histidine kinase